jgi:uncharacterized membrane protein YgcG
VLVPLNPQKSFGDLYEIRSTPSEIFVNGATIDNIDVITALTQSNIRSQTSVSGLNPTVGTGFTNGGGGSSGGSGGGSSGGSGDNGGGSY